MPDPIPNLLTAYVFVAEVLQGQIDSFSDFTRCIEQSTIEVIHNKCHSSLQLRRDVCDP
jgi:hypothetical protein